MSELRKGFCRRCGANRWAGQRHSSLCPHREDSERYNANKVVPIRLPRGLRPPSIWRGLRRRRH